MIIVCNSCSAQYSVSDAKVRGKLVRITCKHCSTAIVVDGRQMTETEGASQKPLSGYALPRRDESIIASMPHSVAPAGGRTSVPAPVSAPAHAPVSGSAPAPVPAPASAPVSASAHAAVSASAHAPAHAAVPAARHSPAAAPREEEQTMIARSRFGDEMSVHEERTVIGQIPKEALEFERMFAQRTQPPPPEAPSAPVHLSPSVLFVPREAPLPSFSSEPPESGESAVGSERPPTAHSADSESESESEQAPAPAPASSKPLTVGHQPTSDTRGLVSLAEATHPSVARAVSARRLRVTLITLLVLAVLVLLFVIQMPR